MVDEVVTSARHQTTLDEAAERLTEAVARPAFTPRRNLVFTGGSASLLGGDFTESDVVRQFWREMGVDETRVVFEDKSRNTFENAIFTRELVHPRKNERWLLITSAFHMPRAVGIFRRAGMTLIPYPVDYRTTGTAHDFRISPDGPLALRLSELALREWIGLFAYWASGKTDSSVPGAGNRGLARPPQRPLPAPLRNLDQFPERVIIGAVHRPQIQLADRQRPKGWPKRGEQSLDGRPRRRQMPTRDGAQFGERGAQALRIALRKQVARRQVMPIREGRPANSIGCETDAREAPATSR